MTIPRKDTLTQAELKSILDYNPDTGIFTRTKTICNRAKQGDIVGSRNDSGYLFVRIATHSYRLHRIAVLFMTGAFPKDYIDHINHIKDDNRWDNLRECTKTQNGVNRGKNKNNTSGYKGVSWMKLKDKFRADIKYKGRQLCLGHYDCRHDAASAYNIKATELFGEFAYLNQIPS